MNEMNYPTLIFSFGKYKGRTPESVCFEEPSYIEYLEHAGIINDISFVTPKLKERLLAILAKGRNLKLNCTCDHCDT